MTKHRHTASTITDDTLDRLYDNASRGWRRGDRWKRTAEKAEATIERARRFADQLDDIDREALLEVLGVPPAPSRGGFAEAREAVRKARGDEACPAVPILFACDQPEENSAP
jgi:hypothetical protein